MFYSLHCYFRIVFRRRRRDEAVAVHSPILLPCSCWERKRWWECLGGAFYRLITCFYIQIWGVFFLDMLFLPANSKSDGSYQVMAYGTKYVAVVAISRIPCWYRNLIIYCRYSTKSCLSQVRSCQISRSIRCNDQPFADCNMNENLQCHLVHESRPKPSD